MIVGLENFMVWVNGDFGDSISRKFFCDNVGSAHIKLIFFFLMIKNNFFSKFYFVMLIVGEKCSTVNI